MEKNLSIDMDEETVEIEGRNYYRDPGDIVDIPGSMHCPKCGFWYEFDCVDVEEEWDCDEDGSSRQTGIFYGKDIIEVHRDITGEKRGFICETTHLMVVDLLIGHVKTVE